MGASCPSENTELVEQDTFWTASGGWDGHKVGWAIAGGCAMLTVLISMTSVMLHCRNYTNPREQRQIIRILYMPLIYAVISFFSYRFFRDYTYYSLIEVAYEAVTLSAFLLLLIEFVASTSQEHKAEAAIARKDKRPLPLPFSCFRYRPTKPYFMYTVKYSVLQYIIIRPLCSLIGIICQIFGVLCETAGLSFRWANLWLEGINFISITIALYGLLVFYGLVSEELKGRRPLAKFLAIKLIVMATFYQGFIFDMLEGRVIKPTQYWTTTNIADGLNALAICIEMVFFSMFMLWAYSSSEYIIHGAKKTSVWRPLWDSINFSDFFVEIYTSCAFFISTLLGRKPPPARSTRVAMGKDGKPNMDFGEAFGVTPGYAYSGSGFQASMVNLNGGGAGVGARPERRAEGYEEGIRLAPYIYRESPESGGPTGKMGQGGPMPTHGYRGMADIFPL